MKQKQKKGAITVIFLTLVALVLTLLLAATQSRLLFALRRSQSVADTLASSYEAESEVNDIMARLMGGYLTSADIPTTSKTIGDIRLEIEGQDFGNTQIVTVTAYKGLAVSKVQATRKIQSIEGTDNVDIILALDCTSSMDTKDADPDCHGNLCPTRFDALESASLNFVDQVSNLPDHDKFRLGLTVFGTDYKWFNVGGVDITPNSGLTFDQIKVAINNGFSSTRQLSDACKGTMDGTSVGSAFVSGHEYLKNNKSTGTKQIEIVITDGEPNSRIPNSECLPDSFCPILSGYCGSNPHGWSCQTDGNGRLISGGACESSGKNFLACSLADKNTFSSEAGQNGIRDPEVDAYAVTILSNPPADVVSIFQKYTSPDGYFNATRANQLGNKLNDILTKIVENRSNISIKRIIPTPQ